MSPINYKLYPSNWQEIRKRILDRENNCCKTCRAKNGSYVFRGLLDGVEVFVTGEEKVYRLSDGEYLSDNLQLDIQPSSGDPEQKAIKIVLTVAHLNHDIKDNRDENLAALCQMHHLRHDKDQHKANSRETIARKRGLQNLFK